MKNNNKMVYSILDIIGGILLLLALVLNTMELASTILIGLLAIIGFVLCLPDNIVFLKRKINENAELGCYWVVKFLATLLGLLLSQVTLLLVFPKYNVAPCISLLTFTPVVYGWLPLPLPEILLIRITGVAVGPVSN